MSAEKNKVDCAGCIVFRINEEDNIEFLLMRHQKNPSMWSIPKGHCEPGESIEETAVRETYEETGAVARPLYELTPVFTTTPKEIKVVYFFLARHMNSECPLCEPNEETAEVGWHQADKMPNIHEYQKPVIKNAIVAINRNT